MIPAVRTITAISALLLASGCDAKGATDSKQAEYERAGNELRPAMERLASKNAEYVRTTDALTHLGDPGHTGPGLDELMASLREQCLDAEPDLKSLKLDAASFEDPELKTLFTQLAKSVDDYQRGRMVCERSGGMDCLEACGTGWMGTNGVLNVVRDHFGKSGIQLPELNTEISATRS